MFFEKLKGLAIGLVLGITITGGIGLAVNADTLYDVITSGVKIVIDGQRLYPTDANGNPVEPLIYNGTTYLPVRAVANAFGKEVYWDGPNYTVYLGSLDGALNQPSLLLEDAVNIGGNLWKQSPFTDNYGNTYSVALGTWLTNPEYLLNMKYSRFKGTLAVKQGETDNDSTVVKIKADGKVIYTSPVMTKTSTPVALDIDIRGCNDFQIEYDINKNIRVYFADCGFYQ